jgi:hypothetical protein
VFFLSAGSSSNVKEAAMNASARKAQQIVTARRRANKKRSLSSVVATVTENVQARKTVTAALRKAAKTLREAGKLGRVQRRIRRIGVAVRLNYRYTVAQVAAIAAAYRPRKAEYVAVRNALAAAA